MNWILLAIIALLCFSVMVCLISFVAKKGIPISFILFGIFTVGMVSYFIQTAITTQFKFAFTPLSVGLIVIMGILSFIGNWAQFQASTTAPNPGLAIAIVSLQSGLIALIALYVFKDKMTALQAAGLIVSLIGILMISIGGTQKTESASIITTKSESQVQSK